MEKIPKIVQKYNPLTQDIYQSIKVGDTIERMLMFLIPSYLNVINVTETTIDCGWVFDRKSGLEIDNDIPTTVSYISKVLTESEKKIIKNGGKLA